MGLPVVFCGTSEHPIIFREQGNTGLYFKRTGECTLGDMECDDLEKKNWDNKTFATSADSDQHAHPHERDDITFTLTVLYDGKINK